MAVPKHELRRAALESLDKRVRSLQLKSYMKENSDENPVK